MADIINAIKGTRDFYGSEVQRLAYIESCALSAARSFGFGELRTPVFEYTELFGRGVGDTTDVVQKEMYTFTDKGDRSITLRPEGTAGVVRAFLEHGLYNEPLPQKLSYLTTCYRYEKPQSGRQREFRQFGAECIGSASPLADYEVISLAHTFFDTIMLDDLRLELNSIGCPDCRKAYLDALREYFTAHKDELCPTCLDRLGRNPMRILDCKSPVCSAIAANAPVVLDYICDDCRNHFETLKSYLDAAQIEYTVNPQIVRGLDYYTRTVFEFVSCNEQTAGLVCCGGGRYDGLVQELGGAPLAACGFAVGLERTLLAMQAANVQFPEDPGCDLAVITAGSEACVTAVKLADELRRDGYTVIIDLMERSVKAQMKYAGKMGARYTVVIGTDELQSGKAVLKNMQSSDKRDIDLNDFAQDFERAVLSDGMGSICDVSLL